MRIWRMIRPLVVLMLGFPPLINMLGNPRLKALHGPDILQILAVGFCFGAGFALLVVSVQGRRDRLGGGRPEEVQGR